MLILSFLSKCPWSRLEHWIVLCVQHCYRLRIKSGITMFTPNHRLGSLPDFRWIPMVKDGCRPPGCKQSPVQEPGFLRDGIGSCLQTRRRNSNNNNNNNNDGR
mmetsp:Transcript_1918/g.5091  ORF Transcript_1918/g.5091 Transcript_1918/m.5091 type:complete len:103 (+) Transcript_1918:57-365(+)